LKNIFILNKKLNLKLILIMSIIIITTAVIILIIILFIKNDNNFYIKRRLLNKINDNSVYVKGGAFIIGEGQSKHKVILSGYYIGKYNVTVKEFKEFVNETGYITLAEKIGYADWYDEENNIFHTKKGANWRNTGFNQEEDHPVVNICWYDAIKYCNWLSKKCGLKEVYNIHEVKKDLDNENIYDSNKPIWITKVNWKANGYRLPTEAEWEYAARSCGKEVRFAWGNELFPEFNGKKHANVADESFKLKFDKSVIFRRYGIKYIPYNDGYIFTSPVDEFEPNELGIYDMTGNVWQWCWDWKGEYNNKIVTNPKGVNNGNSRILRGGSFFANDDSCSVWIRGANNPSFSSICYGFRITRNL